MNDLDEKHFQKEDLNEGYLNEEDEDNLHPHSPTYENEYEERPQEKLECLIMEEVFKLEKKDDNISEDVEDKLKEMVQRIPRNNYEEALTLRMHELALSKILVFTHGKSDFRLVEAHHHIGEAYLNYKCYEQAIDHLTVALKKNAKLTEIKETKLYHSYMLTTLSRCYFEISSYEDALEVLKRANDIQSGCQPPPPSAYLDNTQTLKLIAECYLKLKDYKSALEYIQQTLNLLVKIHGEGSKECALASVLKARIFVAEGNRAKGTEELKHAIALLQGLNYRGREQIADLYQKLAEYYEGFEDIEKQIQALKERYDILQAIYGYTDKKVIKSKKHIAMVLLKNDKVKNAIIELEDLHETEEKVYGENSVQVGKTKKILGCVHLGRKNFGQAEMYLKKAQKILHQLGYPKLVKEIKAKLTLLRETKQQSKVVPS